MSLSIPVRRQLVAAALVGLALRLCFIRSFPLETPDSKLYEELARNWLDYGVYGIFLGGNLTPVDIRAPGYPAFLALIYALLGRTRLAVLLVQGVLDLFTCFLTAVLAVQLASKQSRGRVAVAALWLAATCPFLANYTAVPLTEILATFLSTFALLFLLAGYMGIRTIDLFPHSLYVSVVLQPWLLGALFVGLCTLVRPETPLLLVAVGLLLAFRWGRPRDWPKLIRTGALLGVGLLLPLIPWGARNWVTLHRVQFLAPRYAELPGEFVPHGFYAWTNTWLVRFRDVYLTIWKFEEEPIPIETLPPSAFDSPEERARVIELLNQYNAELALSPEQDKEFARLAHERARRHPLRTYLQIPVERAATLWLTPRIELLPYSGHLRPLRQRWDQDRVDFLVTVGFGLLSFAYVGMAFMGAWRWRRQPGVALLVAFLLVRTAFFTLFEWPEPRYLLVCFPALLALAALVWSPPSEGLMAPKEKLETDFQFRFWGPWKR